MSDDTKRPTRDTRRVTRRSLGGDPADPDATGEARPSRYVSPDVDSGPENARPEPVDDRTGQLGATAAKYDLGAQDDLLLDALGDLPPGYGQTYLSLAARDPSWLFAYWDVNDPGMVAAAEEHGWDRLTLRVHRLGGPSTDIRVGPRGGRWYVKVPAPDAGYYAELGLALPEGRFRRFAVSNRVRTPPGGPADDPPPAFATLPWEFERERITSDDAPPPADDAGPDERLRERIERAERSAVSPPLAGDDGPARPPAGGEPGAPATGEGGEPPEDAPSSDPAVRSGGRPAVDAGEDRDLRKEGPPPPAATVHPRERRGAPSSEEPPPGGARRQAPSSGELQAPSSSTGRPRGD